MWRPPQHFCTILFVYLHFIVFYDNLQFAHNMEAYKRRSEYVQTRHGGKYGVVQASKKAAKLSPICSHWRLLRATSGQGYVGPPKGGEHTLMHSRYNMSPWYNRKFLLCAEVSQLFAAIKLAKINQSTEVRMTTFVPKLLALNDCPNKRGNIRPKHLWRLPERQV